MCVVEWWVGGGVLVKREEKRAEKQRRSTPPARSRSLSHHPYLLRLELDLQVLALALQADAHFVQQVVDLGQRGKERVFGGEKVVDLC